MKQMPTLLLVIGCVCLAAGDPPGLPATSVDATSGGQPQSDGARFR